VRLKGKRPAPTRNNQGKRASKSGHPPALGRKYQIIQLAETQDRSKNENHLLFATCLNIADD
jgi:hypothetical protein